MSNQPQVEESKTFRDSISTVDTEGKRLWIYPKKPSGRLYNARKWVSAILLIILFGTPFIKIDGEPLFLFNFLERKFILMGVTFFPQDFHLFVLTFITGVFFIVLFTVVFGRVWCGWACPQTIFMEMVFRRIEYWIDGDAGMQRKLSKAPWNGEKIIKRVSKYAIFAAISFLIGNTLMAYIVGIDETLSIITSPPAEHWAGFTAVIAFSGVFFFVFSYFREQACTVVCPYGRFQGAMLDKDSIVVAYDFVRGEPRGKMKKGEIQEGNGDCIDCHACVHVCPTGIDIRNGTQLECVNCTACIDACDDIMDKIDKPRGLIRYDSFNGIDKKTKFRFTPRAIGYTVVLTILIGIIGFLMSGRDEVETLVLRTPGMLYQRVDEYTFSNLYNLQLVNKTREEMPIEIRLLEPKGKIRLIGNEISVPPEGQIKQAFFVDIDEDLMESRKTEIKLGIYSEDRLIDKVSTSFLGPSK